MLRVLLVDDDVHVARAIARVLKSRAMVARLADSVATASAALIADRFDMVICDLALGGDSGLRVLDGLRQRGDLTPFVLVTGSAATDRLGADGDPRIAAVLLKPFDVSTLDRVLRDVLDAARRGGP